MNVPLGWYGAETPVASPDYASQALTALPALADIIAPKDPRVLRAQLNAAVARGAPVSTIASLRARYDAAVEKQVSGSEWRTLGKVGAIVGIGVGAAAIFYILTKALK